MFNVTLMMSSLQRANQASTLAWGTRMKGFIICFVLGVFCSILVSSRGNSLPVCLHGNCLCVSMVTTCLCVRVPVCCGFQVSVSLCSLSSTVWETSALWPGNNQNQTRTKSGLTWSNESPTTQTQAELNQVKQGH